MTDDETFEIIAQIDLDGGRLTFLDETIGKDVAVGILEEGQVDLGPLYEQNATALEIFLALAPPSLKVPDVLYLAHDLARQNDPRISEEPRDLTNSDDQLDTFKALVKHDFANDTINCWGWGNVSVHDRPLGNPPESYDGHESTNATQEFETWSGIPTGFQTTDLHAYDENAELSDREYQTGWAHERALAMCVTHAIYETTENDCYGDNTVNYRTRLYGENENGSWASNNIYVTGYGQGVRYRSSSTESRRYRLLVVDVSVESLVCKENYQVDMRWRFNPPLSL